MHAVYKYMILFPSPFHSLCYSKSSLRFNTYAWLSHPSCHQNFAFLFFKKKKAIKKTPTKNSVSLTNYTASITLEMSVWYSNVSLWGSNNRTEPAGDTENITSRKMHVLHLSVMCFQFPTFMNSHIADIWVRFFSQCWIWAFWLKHNVRNMGLRLSWAFVLRVQCKCGKCTQ